jgi:hypothetical protein
MTVAKACKQSDRGSNDTVGTVWARVTCGGWYKLLQVAQLSNTRMLLLSVIRAALTVVKMLPVSADVSTAQG